MLTGVNNQFIFASKSNHSYTDGKGSICIFSYNSRGFTEDKQEICKTLLMDTDEYYPILCNQENFLLKSNSYKVTQCFPDAKVIFKEAIKESFEGRPKNGMFVVIPNELKAMAEDVSPHHWRVQAVMMTLATKVLIINSYFPTDPRVNDFDSTDLDSTISAIRSVISDNVFDSVVWCGDINADFARNTRFTTTVDEFVSENSFVDAWKKFQIDYTHVFETDGRTYTSTLDRFFWSEKISGCVKEADVLHLLSNTSDHCPVYCKLDVGEIGVTNIQEATRLGQMDNHPSWKKATAEQREEYRFILEEQLKTIKVPVTLHDCSNVHCERVDHTLETDQYLIEILESVRSAADRCLPSNKRTKPDSTKKKKPTPNWKMDVQPFKDTAQFWHSVWISAGKPINTALHNVMRRSRNVYHYQIRKSRRMTDYIRKNKLLDACFNDNGDIFKEIRKMRKAPTPTASMIDGVTSNIEGHFSTVYERLYNSIDDKENLEAISRHLSENIDAHSLEEIDRITPKLIRTAISKLKNGKTDPVFQYSSDCLKDPPEVLCEHLALVFKMFLVHGHVSSMIMVSTIIPLIKDKLGDTNASNNYRSIALSSLVLKIFDWVVLLLFDKKLSTDELQFGYQEKTSTNMCTWLAVEVIDYYMRHGSEVFVGVMDMTKAFDNVKQSVLFQKLIDRKVPAVFLRLILKMHLQQRACVSWNGQISGTFAVSNGVKQGGVLSARLFCVYIDDIFQLLRRKKSGCWVNGNYAGILGYADDLLLLAPSRDALQEMIKNCEKHTRDLNISFSTHENPKKCKTKCMAFLDKERDVKNIILDGKDLPWVSSAKHLGCRLTNTSGALTKDIMEKRAIFINRVNELNQEFYFAHPLTKVRINNIFNSYFYGSPLWNLFGKEADRLEKSWNVAQRILMGLPRNSHRYFIEPLSDTQHIRNSLFRRYIKFINSIKTSEKAVLRAMLLTVKQDCRSTTGMNLRNLMKTMGRSTVDELQPNDAEKLTYKAIPEEDEWKVACAKELIEVKNGIMGVDMLTTKELDQILEEVVT